MTAPENPREVIGGNNPPEATPFEAARDRIEDLYGEALLWMDGKPVESAEICDGIANLQSLIMQARKMADEARKTENKPFDEGKAEVQGRYNPILKKADTAIAACREAQAPWLKQIADENEAEALRLQKDAIEKAEAAKAAFAESDSTDLAARAKAETLLDEAKQAEKSAHKAARETATAGGTFGRSSSLRTVRTATLDYPIIAVRHYWSVEPEAFRAFLQDLADKDIRKGVLEIPGFTIATDKRVI